MTEDSEKQKPPEEASMDEILSSIRKMISDDDQPEQALSEEQNAGAVMETGSSDVVSDSGAGGVSGEPEDVTKNDGEIKSDQLSAGSLVTATSEVSIEPGSTSNLGGTSAAVESDASLINSSDRNASIIDTGEQAMSSISGSSISEESQHEMENTNEAASSDDLEDVLSLTKSMIDQDGASNHLGSGMGSVPNTPPELKISTSLGGESNMSDSSNAETKDDLDLQLKEETLMSEKAKEASANVLHTLTQAAQQSHPKTPLGQLDRTLEDMIQDLMRPMLKSWLDSNLPSIVEKVVQKEVERLTSRL